MTEKKDPRFLNQLPQSEKLYDYLMEYSSLLKTGLTSLDSKALDQAFTCLEDVMQKGHHVYAAGNGGSSAICSHLVCDWTKGTHTHGLPPLKTHSLSSEVSLMTAVANDFSYEECFSRQIEMYAMPGDVVVLISSSGNSPNIIQALQAAKKKGLKTIGLTGFSGGKLREGCDISLHIPINNYGVVEDSHQMIMHTLAQFLAKKRDQKL